MVRTTRRKTQLSSQCEQGVVPGLDPEDVLYHVVIDECVSKSLANILQTRDQEQQSLVISMAVIPQYPFEVSSRT